MLNIVRAPMGKRSSKWIEGLDPDCPASKAARKTLRRRLRAVWKYLGDAARRPDENPEFVHQLRVSTRRAMAALAGYTELLPRRKAAWMEKQLKRIRRRAGAARDYDVMLERLKARSDAARLTPLVEKIGELRSEAQEPIGRIHRKLRRRNFSKRTTKLLKSIHAPHDRRGATYLDWARLCMVRNVDAFFIAAAGDLNDLAALHQFRIEGKQLRYAVEYLAGAFDSELRDELYPAVEQVQALLGMVNDHASAIDHYETWRLRFPEPQLTALVEELLVAERQSLEAARLEFFRWWTPQRVVDLKHRFEEVLQLSGREEVA